MKKLFIKKVKSPNQIKDEYWIPVSQYVPTEEHKLFFLSSCCIFNYFNNKLFHFQVTNAKTIAVRKDLFDSSAAVVRIF